MACITSSSNMTMFEDSSCNNSSATNIMILPTPASLLPMRMDSTARSNSLRRLKLMEAADNAVASPTLTGAAAAAYASQKNNTKTQLWESVVQSLPFDHVFVLDLDTTRTDASTTASSSDACYSYLYRNPAFQRLGFTQGFQGGVLSQESAAQLDAVLQVALGNLTQKTTHSQWVTFHHAETVLPEHSTAEVMWDLTLFPIRDDAASSNNKVTALGGWINVRQVRSEADTNTTAASTKDLLEYDVDDDSSNPNSPTACAAPEPGQLRRGSSIGYSGSQRRELMEAARESEERHQTLFENMKQGVVYHAVDGSTMAANRSALRILGLTMDQMLGRTPLDPQWKFVYEDGTAIPVEKYPAVVALSGTPVTNMIIGVYTGGSVKDGNINWCQLDAMPRFRPGEDKPYQAYTIFTDITQAKLVEQNLTRAKEKAEEADHLKSAFLATMSHEIRTPLNGIMGHLDLILSNGLDQDCRDENLEGLHVALHSGNLLLSIIQDILDLSKIEAGQLDMEDMCIPVRAMVANTMKLAKAYCIQRKKEHLQLKTMVHENVAECAAGDQFRVQQILNNLLSNAVKFTDSGFVTLSVQQVYCRELEQNCIEFCVQDTGKGIPEDRLEDIFEPFRQMDFSDTREHGGTGLGLTIVKKLVEIMGGNMNVSSNVNEGTSGSRFYFRLPYKPMDGPYDASPSEECQATDLVLQFSSPPPSLPGSRPVSPAVPNHRTGTVLLAEDDLVSRKVATRMLEKAGMEVMAARDGAEAVALFKKHRHEIDMVLMDVMMPVMDGLEATERIREIELQSADPVSVPICALSAGAMKGDKERGLAIGMTDYLYKPINRLQLFRTIETYLGQATPGVEANECVLPELQNVPKAA